MRLQDNNTNRMRKTERKKPGEYFKILQEVITVLNFAFGCSIWQIANICFQILAILVIASTFTKDKKAFSGNVAAL